MMLSTFWSWYIIVITLVTIAACFWLLQWTKGIKSDDDGDGTGATEHVWDHDLVEHNNPLPKWWLNLFYITIVFALVYLGLYGGLGNIPGVYDWSQEGQWSDEMAEAELSQQAIFARYRELDDKALIADAEANATGQRLFANSCAMCHGSDGRGARGFPNLTDDDWLYGGSMDAVLQSISNGRVGVMPVMVGGLDDRGINELLVYVQSLSGQKADASMAQKGKKHFDMLCVACHQADGTGNQALGAPNLTDDIWLYGSDPQSIKQTITQGRNGNMPAHENLLSEDRRRLLAAYVLSLSEN